MKRNKYNTNYYGLGYFINRREFGFIRHGNDLTSLLQCQGKRDHRIVRFTTQGLKTIYRHHIKQGWREV